MMHTLLLKCTELHQAFTVLADTEVVLCCFADGAAAFAAQHHAGRRQGV